MRPRSTAIALSWCAACATCFAALSVAPPARASGPGPGDGAPAPESGGLWSKYTTYFDKKLDELIQKPIWGITSQLPEGVLKFRYEWSPASADSYFDNDGKVITLLPPIDFTDFPNPGDKLVIDPRVKGSGAEHAFQIAYGVTDTFNVFLEAPFTTATTTLDLRTYLNGQRLDPVGLEFALLQTFIQANGRPLPGTEFESSMDLGDMRAGTSWNYTRTKHVSAALTPSVFLPTGTPADPNNDLAFLRGPEIDRGIGAWAVNFTHSLDLRPIDWLIFNLELSSTYRFAYDRESPKWLPITDCARIQDPARRAEVCSPASPAYDRAYDLDQSAVFPDLSGLADTYEVEGGLSFGFVAGVMLELTPIPVQFAYHFDRSEAPSIRASGSGDSGPSFERLIDSLALFEATELHTIGVGIALPLFPLYVPMTVTPTARWAVAGKNVIRLEAQYSVAFELYLPIGDLYMSPPAGKTAAQKAGQ